MAKRMLDGSPYSSSEEAKTAGYSCLTAEPSSSGGLRISSELPLMGELPSPAPVDDGGKALADLYTETLKAADALIVKMKAGTLNRTLREELKWFEAFTDHLRDGHDCANFVECSNLGRFFSAAIAWEDELDDEDKTEELKAFVGIGGKLNDYLGRNELEAAEFSVPLVGTEEDILETQRRLEVVVRKELLKIQRELGKKYGYKSDKRHGAKTLELENPDGTCSIAILAGEQLEVPDDVRNVFSKLATLLPQGGPFEFALGEKATR